jgi:hypothetical protein
MKRNWHEFEIYTVNEKLRDIGVNNNQRSKCSIDLNQVNSFNETVHTDLDEVGVTVYLDSGEQFSLIMTYDEFQQLISIKELV